MTDTQLEKVVFELDVQEGWPPVGTESVWCHRQGNGTYRLANIPFFVTAATLGDLVSVQESGGKLCFSNVSHYSGNSLIRIVLENESEVQIVTQQFETMGCETEWHSNFKIIALSVPPNVSLAVIQSELQKGKANDRWDYEEPLLHE